MNKTLKTSAIIAVGVPAIWVLFNFSRGFIKGFKIGYDEQINKNRA